MSVHHQSSSYQIAEIKVPVKCQLIKVTVVFSGNNTVCENVASGIANLTEVDNFML